MATQYLEKLNEIAKKELLELQTKQQIKLMKAYKEAAEDLVKKVRMSPNGSVSQAYYKQYAQSLYGELKNTIEEFSYSSAMIPYELHNAMLNEIANIAGVQGIDFSKALKHIPKLAARIVADGGIYSDGKSLSARLWNVTYGYADKVQDIVNRGVAQGMSAVELSKLLEGYVNPTATKVWNRAKITEKLGSGYAWVADGRVEYNALRLARTTITHTYQVATIHSARENPFVEGLKWHSVHATGRTCELCKERHNQVYKIDEMPFDHPNGLCYQTPHIPKSLNAVGNDLADWVKKGTDDGGVLDKWWTKLGHQVGGSNFVEEMLAVKFKYTQHHDGRTKVHFKKQDGKSYTTLVRPSLRDYCAEFEIAENIEARQDVLVALKEMMNITKSKDRYKEYKTLLEFLTKVSDDTVVMTKLNSQVMGSATRDYIKFQSKSAAMSYGQKNLSQQWLDQLTRAETDATVTYTGGSYRSINKFLRKGELSGGWGREEMKSLTDNITRALSKGVPVTDDLIVYRGTSRAVLGDIPWYEAKGAVIVDKGFMSTSMFSGTAFDGDTIMEIRVPKGTGNCGFVADISQVKREIELLFNRGTRLKVLESKMENRIVKLVLEVIP